MRTASGFPLPGIWNASYATALADSPWPSHSLSQVIRHWSRGGKPDIYPSSQAKRLHPCLMWPPVTSIIFKFQTASWSHPQTHPHNLFTKGNDGLQSWTLLYWKLSEIISNFSYAVRVAVVSQNAPCSELSGLRGSGEKASLFLPSMNHSCFRTGELNRSWCLVNTHS